MAPARLRDKWFAWPRPNAGFVGKLHPAHAHSQDLEKALFLIGPYRLHIENGGLLAFPTRERYRDVHKGTGQSHATTPPPLS